MNHLMHSILEQMANQPGALNSHVIADGTSMAINRIRELEACLRDTREEICKGPVDDTLWHTSKPACTTVDNICMTLDDNWEYDQWLQTNSTEREPKNLPRPKKRRK